MSRITWFLKGHDDEIYLPSVSMTLAQRVESGAILVNLDRTGARFPTTMIMRRKLLWRWGAKKYDFVPVSRNALSNALSNALARKDTIKLIERKGRECVFEAQDVNEKTHYFISGYDRHETPALYFLAELPRKVTGLKDAREALKPPSVVAAENMGRIVFRQGDMFAIPTKITTEEIIKQGGIIEDRETDRRFFPTKIKARKLYGTAHTASRVALMPDGTCLAWGKLYHEPKLVGRSRRDHRPCRLRWRHWHLVARNTVPVVKPEPERRRPSDVDDFFNRLVAGRAGRSWQDW